MNDSVPQVINMKPPVWLVALCAASLLVSFGSVGLLFASQNNVVLPAKAQVDSEALVEKVAVLEKALKSLEAGVADKASSADLSGAIVQVNSLSEQVSKTNSMLAETESKFGALNEQLSATSLQLTEMGTAQSNQAALLAPLQNGVLQASGTAEGGTFSVRADKAPGSPRIDVRTLLNGDLHQPLVGGVLNDAKTYQFYMIGTPEGGRANFSDGNALTAASIGASTDTGSSDNSGYVQLSSRGKVFQLTSLDKDNGKIRTSMQLGLPERSSFGAYMRAKDEGGSAGFLDSANSLTAWIGASEDVANSPNSGSIWLYGGGKPYQSTMYYKNSSYVHLGLPGKSWATTLQASSEGGRATFRDSSGSVSARIGTTDDSSVSGKAGYLELFAAGKKFQQSTIKQENGSYVSSLYLGTPNNSSWALYLRATDEEGSLTTCRTSTGNCATFGAGADVAERFPSYGDVRPGDAVAMRDVGGQVVAVRSASASDSSVLGIVSGAGNLRPAVVIGNDHDNAVQVAIGGTVYARVEADSGAISAGTLLVTSSVRGHLMRAPAQPKPGSIVGKAMDSLSSGRALIRVWVSHH